MTPEEEAKAIELARQQVAKHANCQIDRALLAALPVVDEARYKREPTGGPLQRALDAFDKVVPRG